jgi:hypothetical protein
MKIATSMIAAVVASLVLSCDSATTPDGAAPSGDDKADDGSQERHPADPPSDHRSATGGRLQDRRSGELDARLPFH